MKRKNFYLYSILVSVATLLMVGSLVRAQTFTEPPEVVNLPIPISTSSAPQAIDSALGLGISSDVEFPQGAALFVKGTTLTKPSDAGIPADVRVGANLLLLQNSQVQISTSLCPNNARVCVKAGATDDPNSFNGTALHVLQETGIGLFGETAASGKAGVYGSGYYGVKAVANDGGSTSIALKAQSCDVTGGTPGVCINYGTAGFFSGDFVIEDDVDNNNTNKVSGALSGNGENLYRVKSLYNLAEGDDPTSHGVAYKSFGMSPAIITVPPTGSTTVSDVVDTGAGEIFLTAIVSEGDGATFYSARYIQATYNSSANELTLSNSSTGLLEVRIIVSYLLH